MKDTLLTENIFNLTQPEYYDCYVERYHSSLHVLRLRADRFEDFRVASENVIEVIFSDVLFYSGPLFWTSANICIAPKDACLDALYEGGVINPETPAEEIEETLETYQLFVIFTESEAQVRFVAHHSEFTMNVIS